MDDWRGKVIGPYRVVDRIGQGGMGMVWRARDEQLERDVAIKMLRSDTSCTKENTARLMIEARAAAGIKSRHVAQVLQLGTTDDGESYVVMELLEGKTLLDVVTHDRRLPAERAVHIARHVAKAMEAAHELGIVHRDLKPANVMLVAADGEDEVAKVLDFGIAKRTKSADDHLTDSGVLLGTLNFMAPEQLDGRPVDTRADIYSLGVLLYRMLTGRTVFESASLRELSDLVVFAIPRPVRDFVPIPKRLDDLVLKCLAKRPEDRFQTMAEVEAALAISLDPETASFTLERRRDFNNHVPHDVQDVHDAASDASLPGAHGTDPTIVGPSSAADDARNAGNARGAADDARNAGNARGAADDARGIDGARGAADDARGIDGARGAADDARGIDGARGAADDARGIDGARGAADDARGIDGARGADVVRGNAPSPSTRQAARYAEVATRHTAANEVDEDLELSGVAQSAAHRSAALVVAAAALALVVACLAIRGASTTRDETADGFIHVRTAGTAQ